jgi:PAS domain S-box-containing protein
MGKICIIIMLLLIHLYSYGQEIGMPLIRNYAPREYVFSAQVYCTTQEKNGIMYFGATDIGILEYDGVEWRGIPNDYKTEVFGMEFCSKGTMYIGATNDFGRLLTDRQGKKKFGSLKHLLPDPLQNIGNVWNVHILNDDVYFFTEKCLYIYNIPSNRIDMLKPEAGGSFYVPFAFSGKYYILHASKGILVLENKQLLPVPNTAFFSKQIFLTTLPYDEKRVLIPTRTAGVYVLDLTGTEPVRKLQERSLDEFLRDNNIYTSILANNGMFLLCSMENGAVLIDRSGKIHSYINESTGLQNNLILGARKDLSMNSWLTLSIGISKADLGQDITYWDKRNGLQGNIFDITRYKGLIYFVTNQKLYVLEPPGSNVNGTNPLLYKLKSIKGVPAGQLWTLAKFNVPGKKGTEILLAGSQFGIHELKDGILQDVYKGKLHAFAICQSAKNPSRIYSTDGFADFISLVYKNGQWLFEGKWEGIDDDIRDIVEDADGNLWLGTTTNGVLHIKVNEGLITRPEKIVRYTESNGLPVRNNVKPVILNNRVVFATEHGLYSFNKQKEQFEPYFIGNKQFDDERIGINNLVIAADGNICVSSRNSYRGKIGYLKPVNGSYTWHYQAFKRFPEMASIMALHADEDGTIWVGSNEGLFAYKPAHDIRNYDMEFECLIRKVSIANDSVVFWGSTGSNDSIQKLRLDFSDNTIRFQFAAPFFDHEDRTQYSFILEGYDKNWSTWSGNSFKEYTKVKEGKYTFKVKARNIYDKESTTASFEIEVLPPYYRTFAAYVFYTFLLVCIFILGIRFYSGYLIRQKKQLEYAVDVRTNEIMRQKNEMQSQAEEMAAQSEELNEKAILLRKINEELEKLSIVASETDNAVSIMDGTGHFLWVNSGYTRLYGYSQEEFLEMHDSIFDACPNEEIAQTIRNCIANKQTVVYQLALETKFGRQIHVQTTITPILNFSGEVEKLVAIDSDITRLKEADFEIKKQNEEIIAQKEELEKHRFNLEQIVKERTAELEIAKNKAEESDRLKSAFLANMSHEIRTPMNAIIGFSNLLVMPDITQQQKEEFTQLIIHSGNSLLQLIDDIIDIAKIEAGELKLNLTDCNVIELLNTINDLYAYRISNVFRKKINLTLNTGNGSSGLTIETDPLRLQQVLTNLLDNAIKFTEKGSIEFGFTFDKSKKNTMMKFYVKDTGIGLSPEAQRLIFNRFTKIESDKTKLYRGAGLGLAISRNIVTMLGGEIFVESELNAGSTFYFTIPFKNKDMVPFQKVTNVEKKYDWHTKTVLIAEDEESNYKYLHALLERTGIQIIRSVNGKQVLEKFSAHHVDIILMDIKMPVMDGLQATQFVRKTNSRIPIIALTAYAMHEDEKNCLEAGCNAYIPKPVHANRLLGLMDSLL